jgi:CRP/FNR family cyclic AMP-dependent transcriptional regulator
MTTQTAEKAPGLTYVQKILHLVEERHFNADEYIFREGNEDNNFYIVTQGEIEISKKTSDGHEKVIAELKAGEILGEGVLSGIVIKPASARTVTAVQVLVLPKGNFDKLIKDDPKAGLDFLLSVLGTLNDRIARTDIKLLALYEINKLMGIHRDDIQKLSQGLVQKLIAITDSRDGIILLKKPFEESYRVLYSTTDELTAETFKDFQKDKSRMILNNNFQYLFVDLKGTGFLVLRRDKKDTPYEDDDLRLLILVAEQAGNTIEAASRRASEKARDILHQKKFIL